MKRIVFTLGLWTALCASLALAGEEAPAPPSETETETPKEAASPQKADPALEAKIRDLVKALGDAEFDAREKASRALEAIGKPALEILRKASETTEDPEVRVRAQTAVRRIEEKIREAEKAKVEKVEVGPLVSRSISVVNGKRITWGKDGDGRVLLRYPDPETGEEKEATAFDWKDFLKRHPEISREFGVTETGPRGRGGGFGARVVLGPAIKIKKRKPTSVTLKALGVVVEEVSEVLRYHLGLDKGKGVMVKAAFVTGRGADLGIRKYDIILAFDGNEVKGLDNVQDVCKTFEKITVIQKGKKTELGKAEAEKTEPNKDAEPAEKDEPEEED
jgi:hypothetical protein